MAKNVGRGLAGAASGAATGAKVGAFVGMPWLGAIAGGLIGGAAGMKDSGPSGEQLAAQELKDAWAGTIVLTPEERKVRLEYLKDMGRLTPEMEKEYLQNDTELKGLKVDPKFKAAQMDALQRVSQKGKEGLSLEDRIGLEDIKRKEAQALRGQQEALMANMESRGMGGAGAELAARLQAVQSAADRTSQQDMKIAAQSQKNAFDAMMGAGTLAGQLGEQEFNQQAKVRSAQDTINAFNTGSLQSREMRRVNNLNDAQKYNLDYQKQLEANRAATMNAQQIRDVEDRMGYAADANARSLGKAGQAMNVANAKTQADARNNQGFASTMGSLAGIATAAGDIKMPKWEMPEWMKPANADMYKTQAGADYMKSNYKVNSPVPKLELEDEEMVGGTPTNTPKNWNIG